MCVHICGTVISISIVCIFSNISINYSYVLNKCNTYLCISHIYRYTYISDFVNRYTDEIYKEML